MVYNVWKLLHIVAAIIFLGNITIGIFWKIQADKSKDRLKIAETFKNIIMADKIFTMPSTILLFIFGAGTAMQGNFSLTDTPWILWGIILFIISGYIFMTKFVPLQKQILKLANDPETFSWEAYTLLSKKWNAWGTVVTLAPYIALMLMVLKPGF